MTFPRLNKRQLGKLRIFFRSRAWSNALTFLIFVVIAAVFRIGMPEVEPQKHAQESLDTAVIGLQRLNLKKIGSLTDIDRLDVQQENPAPTDTVLVTIRCVNLPSGRKAMFFPPEVSLLVRATDSRQYELRPDDFEVTVDYSKMTDPSTQACIPTVTRKPSWVKEIRMLPPAVEFIFE
jgi:hypothetical protein